MIAGLVWFILLGSLYLFSAIILFKTSPYLSVTVLLIAFIHFLFRGIRPYLSRRLKARRVRRKISSCIKEHLDVLARKRRQLVRTDDYGLIHFDAWEQEKDYFIENVLSGLFGDFYSNDFPFSEPQIDNMIDKYIDDHQKGHAGGSVSEYKGESWEDVDQQVYRQYCTRLLSLAGWKILFDGDDEGSQNGHFIAQRDEISFLFTCVKSSSPVGRRVIWNTFTEKQKRGADKAAVVTNAGFSRWALLTSSGYRVLALHHDDLANIE